MPAQYDQLLDATIRHLESLKSRGDRYVTASPEALRKLSLPAKPSPSPSQPTGGKAEQSSNENRKAMTDAMSVLRAAGSGTQDASLAPGSQSTIPAAAAHAVPRPATEKTAAFAALRERVLACVKCTHLASSRKNVVFGVGNIDAQLMFVGEAPGADEDTQGEPFVGRAGELLTKIIQAMGLQRGDVYIANILKCRPDTPGQSAGNRKPTSDEMATCVPYLHEQIDLIRPRVIVALGATAIEGLLGKTIGITKMRGQWNTYRGTPLMPTYHPAYLLRNQAVSEKRRVWEDMLAVMEKLEMPISDKQRNYFTKG
ncbi:MAG TPA: uracil-DNA glycosylase [Candidatus Sulfotelmatobacter sp.]|nr:uracil-DNA glycosylase [Candidatus Sulfotelmatobacter sp.]